MKSSVVVILAVTLGVFVELSNASWLKPEFQVNAKAGIVAEFVINALVLVEAVIKRLLIVAIVASNVLVVATLVLRLIIVAFGECRVDTVAFVAFNVLDEFDVQFRFDTVASVVLRLVAVTLVPKILLATKLPIVELVVATK